MDARSLAVLSRLLDDALEVPPSDRTIWLESLGPEYEAFKPRLRAMLDRTPAASDFLATLPKLDASAFDSSPDSRAHAKQPGATVGAYRLIRELASGGQASVWLAERSDHLVNRPVAIKLPHTLAYRPDLGERMARERDILATLNHPHIARLYDAGVTPEGEPFLALEYVEGTTIDRHCREHGHAVNERLGLFLQVLRAVAYAHAQLVIHRDLKPSNMLVAADGSVRLLDFGIARLLNVEPQSDSTLTVIGGRAMTVAYASPEQVARQPLGVATDIYSLGVMLYELLSGDRPYLLARESAAAFEEAILHAEPRRPSEAAGEAALRSTLRGDLDTIVLKALRKAPADRYGTANAFAEDIERYLEGRPVSARPHNAWYRARKFVGRNRVAASAAALVCLAVVGGAGIAIWQAGIARAEQARAEAVTGFIASIFRDVDPGLRGEARPLTAVDVLWLARERLESQLATAPDVRFELRRILGDSLVAVGDPAKAVDVLARTLAEAASTQSNPGTVIETELLLAEAKQYLAKTAESNEHLDRVLSALERTGRVDTEAFVKAKMIRAEVLITSGRAATPEAEAAARAALDAATRVLGPRHQMRARALGYLSTAYRTQSKHELALTSAEEAYRVLRDAHGPSNRHPAVIRAQNEYGRALFQVGRTAEAVKQMKEAAANSLDVLRDDPMTVQHLFGTLANVQLLYGEIDEARVNFEKAVATNLRGVQLSDTYRASQDAVSARIRLAARRPAEALPFYLRAVEGYRKSADTGNLLQLETEYAEVLARLGRFAEARPLLERIVAAKHERLTPAERRAVWQLAVVERLDGHPDRAIAPLQDAVAFAPTSARSKLDKAQFQVDLGAALADLRRFDEARVVLEEARATIEAEQGAPTPLLADALVGLGRVHSAQARHQEALPVLDTAVRFWTGFDAENPAGGEAMLWLGRCQAALGRGDQSRATLTRAAQLLARSPIRQESALARAAIPR
jgi:serine/threonine-protein kinase